MTEAKLYTCFPFNSPCGSCGFQARKSEISNPSELALSMLDEANYSLCYVNSELMVVYPLVMTNSSLLKMAIEIVDLPIKNGDFLQLC
jgi:hypothetical protein